MSDYVTYRDPWRVTLTHDQQYLLRTTTGRETLARWDAHAGTFRRLSANLAGLRHTPIPPERIGAVTTARAPGSAGAKARWCPLKDCHRAPAPVVRVTVASALVEILTDSGPLTTLALYAMLPHHPRGSVRCTLSGLASRGVLTKRHVGPGSAVAWTLHDGGTYTPFVPHAHLVGRLFDSEDVRPWIHPIRARALGLPVVARRRDEPDADFGHPMRGAA